MACGMQKIRLKTVGLIRMPLGDPGNLVSYRDGGHWPANVDVLTKETTKPRKSLRKKIYRPCATNLLSKIKKYRELLYRKVDFYEVATLERGLANGDLEEQAPCNGQVFLRVRNGLCNSTHTPRKIKRVMGG